MSVLIVPWWKADSVRQPVVRAWPPMLLALALLSVFLVQASQARAQAPTPGPGSTEAELIRMAEEFMRALSAKDTATLSGLMVEDATLHSVREGAEGPEIRLSTRADFLNSLGGDERELLERIWDPTVLVSGSVAVVLAPYDFYVEGQFSHCGTDVFTFLKGAEGWRVTGVTYDVIREGCPPSPLGPPGPAVG